MSVMNTTRLSITETIADGRITFFRLPHLRDAGQADAVLYGVPFDSGTTYRPGARFGPYGVRRASLSLGSCDHTGNDVFAGMRVADGGNLVCVPFDVGTAHVQIEQQAHQAFTGGAVPLFVGGDHSCSLPILRAAADAHGPLAVIHFDAHSDTSSAAHWGIDKHHGTVFRNAIEEGHIDPKRFVQLGLRGPFGEPDPHAFTRGKGGIVFEAHEYNDALTFLQSLPTAWGSHPVYVSIDIDVIDPAFAPGTGTPVSGGWTPREMFAAIRALRGIRLVGGDVMEVAPDYDHADITSLCAAHLLFELLTLLPHRAASNS